MKYTKYHMSHEEIAKELKITRNEVRNIENSALYKLRNSAQLKKFLDHKETFETDKHNGSISDIFF